jgi:hypothetical protein
MESLTTQTVNGNGPLLAETAPLLGSNETTAARESRDADIENGTKAAAVNGPYDGPAKPNVKVKVKMTALVPALAIGVRSSSTLYFLPLCETNRRKEKFIKPSHSSLTTKAEYRFSS